MALLRAATIVESTIGSCSKDDATRSICDGTPKSVQVQVSIVMAGSADGVGGLSSSPSDAAFGGA
jgi:hypothetical protein